MIVNNSALWKKALAPDKKVAPPTEAPVVPLTPIVPVTQTTQSTPEPQIIEIVKIDTEKVDNLQKELDEVKLQLKDCGEEKKTCEDQKAILSEKIGELEEKINSTPDEIPSLDGDNLLVEIKVHKETIESLMNEKESDKIELASLESLRDRLEVAEKALETRTKQLVESTRQIDELKQQVSDLIDRIRSINVKNLDDSELKDLRSKISVQELEVSKLSESGKIDSVTITGLKSQLAASKNLLDERDAQLEVNRKDIEIILEQLVIETNYRQQVQEEIKKMKDQSVDITLLDEKIEELRKTNERIQQLNELTGELRGEIVGLKNNVELLTNEVENITPRDEDEIRRLNAEIVAKQEEVDKIPIQRPSDRIMIDELTAKLGESKILLAKKTSEMEALELSNNLLEKNIQTLKDEVSLLEQEVVKMDKLKFDQVEDLTKQLDDKQIEIDTLIKQASIDDMDSRNKLTDLSNKLIVSKNTISTLRGVIIELETSKNDLQNLNKGFISMIDKLKGDNITGVESATVSLDNEHTAKIEEINRENKATIDELKRRHDTKISQINGDNVTRSESDKDSLNKEHEAKIEEINGENKATVEELNNKHDTKIEKINRENKATIEELNNKYEAKIEGNNRDNKATIEELNNKHDAKIEEINRANKATIDELNRRHDTKISQINGDNITGAESDKDSLDKEHEAKIEEINRENKAIVEELNDKHDTKIEKINRENKATVEELNDKHDTKIEKINRENKATIEELNNKYEAKIDEINDENKATIEELNDKHETKVAQINSENKATIAEINGENKATIEELNDKHEAKIDEINGENKATIEELNDKHETKVAQINDENTTRAESVKSSLDERHRAAIEELSDKHNAIIEKLNGENTTEAASVIMRMTEQHKANIEELNDKHKANIEELTEVNQTGVDVLKGQFREATLKRIEGHEDKLRELREEHGQFLAEKEEEYNMTVGELDEESKQNNQKIADLEDASEINNQTIADLQQTNRMLVTNHESDINEINARDLEDSRGLAAIHTEQINALKEANEGYKSEITSLEEENEGYKSERTSLETTHQATINQINEDHVAEIERKEGENQFYIDGLLESHKSTIERFSTGLLETRGQLDASERRVAELEESNSEDLDKLNEWKAYTERLVDSIAKIFDIGGIENASDIDELNRFLLDLDTFKKKASNFKLQMAGKLGISPQSDEDDILGQTDNILSELQILRSQVDSLGIQLVEVIQSKENDIRLLQEEHSNELQETRRRIEEETTENARKEFQPINDMANEARRELAANLEELETLNAYKEGVDEQLSKLERTNNLDPELATSILVDLHNKLSGILDPDGAEFSDDLHSIVETLVQENKDAREAWKKIFETQLTQGETGSLSELVSKLNDKFLSVMSNVGTISGKDRLLEENTIVINELTERVQKLIGIIEEDHTQLTPSQIIQVDQDIAVVSSKIRNIQERIRQNTALDTETEEEKNTRLLADYQIGKEMEKLQDESRSLYRRKSIGMSIPPQLYKDTIDLMDKLEIGTTDN